jgi:hypothetical protein
MEAVVLENKELLERLAKGESAKVNHNLRREFERVLAKHSKGQVVEWNCNCDSRQRMARIILQNE